MVKETNKAPSSSEQRLAGPGVQRLVHRLSRSPKNHHRELKSLVINSDPLSVCTAAKAMAENFPKDSLVRFALMESAKALGESETAFSAAYACLRLAPPNVPARLYLVAQYAANNRIERALSVLGKEDLESEAKEILLERSALHMRLNEFDSAIKVLEVAVKRFPDNVNLLRRLIKAELESGHFDKAVQRSHEACARFPENAGLLYLKAQIAYRQGDLQHALEAAELGYSLTPNNLLISDTYAKILWTFGEFKKAEAVLRRAYLSDRKIRNVDYLKVAGFFNLCRAELPKELINTAGNAKGGNQRGGYEMLYAFALTEQWESAAELIARMAFDGRVSDRLIMYLTLYEEQLLPAASRAGLPSIDLMLQKLKLRATVHNRNDQNLSAVRQLAETVLSRFEEDGYVYPKVSYICPVHRAADVPNLLEQLQRQDWPNAEVIFCINGPGITEADLKLSQNTHFDVRHLDLPHDLKIGQYLQASGDLASGDIIMRIDADDTYLENYTRYMVGCLQHLKADGIAQRPIPFVFEGAGLTFLTSRYRDSPYSCNNETPRNYGDLGSGSTIAVRKEVFETIKHDGTVVVGEDANFLWSIMKAGFKFYSVGGLDHNAHRREDKSHHTWRVNDLTVLGELGQYLCDGAMSHSLRDGLPGENIEDPFGELVEEEAFEGFSELHLGNVFRAPPLPIRLVAGEATKVKDRNHSLLGVSRDLQSGSSFKGISLAFCPNDPDEEAEISGKHGIPAFCHDILPGLIARNAKNPVGLVRAEAGRREEYRERYDRAGLRYVVLSNPRCGSTHLCSLLESLGLGRPQELLRVPAATVLENSKDPSGLFRTFLGAAELEGVVGTKLITQYLTQDLSDTVSQGLLRWMVNEGFRVILLRRPDEDAARSSHVAQKRGVWHRKRGKTYNPARAEQNVLAEETGIGDPEFGMALAMKKTLGYSRWLDDVARRIIPADQVIEVTYEDLVNTEAAVISRITKFLDFDPLPRSVPVSIVKKTPTSWS